MHFRRRNVKIASRATDDEIPCGDGGSVVGRVKPKKPKQPSRQNEHQSHNQRGLKGPSRGFFDATFYSRSADSLNRTKEIARTKKTDDHIVERVQSGRKGYVEYQREDDLFFALVKTSVMFVASLTVIAFLVVLYLLVYHGSPFLGRTTSKGSRNDQWFPTIPSSKLYTIPNSMAHLGDKSDSYAQLRLEWDKKYPPENPDRSFAAMNRSRIPKFDHLLPPNELPYDLYNCPDTPHPNYPHEYSTVQLLKHWPPSQNLPKDEMMAHLALCVFDYRHDYIKALQYRRAEKPFVIRNDPRVAEAVERWNDEQYRSKMIGSDRVRHRAERSQSREFLYWKPDVHAKEMPASNHPVYENLPNDWKEPTELVQMTFAEWYQEAMAKERQLALTEDSMQHFNSTMGPYYYFRLIGCGETGPLGDCDKIDTSEYLFDELTFFQPRPQELYLTDPREQRGIHCRFGMPGIIAENHFDSSRNAIVMLSGQRRYILSHPRYCRNLVLYPLGHPSSRHSQLNWTRIAYNDDWKETNPEFNDSMSSEVVLQSGDVLHLPTNWFHFIVSLSINCQCNTRSGRTAHYDKYIHECGFGSVKV
jgi:hypothetical protein